jgi:hypothetical protein
MNKKARCFGTFCLLILIELSTLAVAHAQNALKTPNISANTLFLYRNSNQDTTTRRNGLDIEESELNFYADVDPYSRLNMVLTVHPEYTATTPPNQANEDWKVEPEELYAESNEIPRFTFRVGKFKAAFGKHNLLHTHVFPFIESPLANTALLGGDDGLNDVGASAAYLFPTEWYSEITLQYLRGYGSNTEFHSPSTNDGVGLAHIKNLFDLNENLTLEAGLSAAHGANSSNSFTNIQGADLTLKWRPVNGGKYHSGILGGEYLHRTMGLNPHSSPDETASGGNIWIQYQFAERWAANLRYDTLAVNNPVTLAIDPATPLTAGTSQRQSAGLLFNATEFSSYRIEYSQGSGLTSLPNQGDEKQIYMQANFTIGSHPSHSY